MTGEGPKDYFVSEILTERDFFVGSMKNARNIFGSRKLNTQRF